MKHEGSMRTELETFSAKCAPCCAQSCCNAPVKCFRSAHSSAPVRRPRLRVSRPRRRRECVVALYLGENIHRIVEVIGFT